MRFNQDHSVDNPDRTFKAKDAPKSTPKFFALKSTKALTIPQEVHLKTEEREKSRQRDVSQGTRNAVGDRTCNIKFLQVK